MRLADSETELTTAATDALLGAVCLGLGLWLWSTPTAAAWKRGLWVSAFALLSSGAWIGAVLHGLQLPAATIAAAWRGLYLSLGWAVALFLVAATCDWKGEREARALLPWALAIGVLLVGATERLGRSFLVFAVYEAVSTAMALAIYGTLAVSGLRPGAILIAAGIVLSLVAAAVQVSSLSLRIVVRFDHNGLFHLVQTVAVVIIAVGVRISLPAGAP
mgnify:CR=1 FL=1